MVVDADVFVQVGLQFTIGVFILLGPVVFFPAPVFNETDSDPRNVINGYLFGYFTGCFALSVVIQYVHRKELFKIQCCRCGRPRLAKHLDANGQCRRQAHLASVSSETQLRSTEEETDKPVTYGVSVPVCG